MGKTQSKLLDDDKKTGFNIVDVCLTTGGIIQFLYFVLFIYTIINIIHQVKKTWEMKMLRCLYLLYL